VVLVATVPEELALATVQVPGLALATARVEEGQTASGAVTFREVAAATGTLLAGARGDTTEQALALRVAEALPALVLMVAGLVVAAVADGDKRYGSRKWGV